MCEEFSQCYDDVNICLWTDGSLRTHSAAQSSCQRRNSSLPRITSRKIQSRLAEFRSADGNVFGGADVWIDVKTVAIDNWHWINGSSLTGLF